MWVMLGQRFPNEGGFEEFFEGIKIFSLHTGTGIPVSAQRESFQLIPGSLPDREFAIAFMTAHRLLCRNVDALKQLLIH